MIRITIDTARALEAREQGDTVGGPGDGVVGVAARIKPSPRAVTPHGALRGETAPPRRLPPRHRRRCRRS